MTDIVITPSGLLDLLSQIDELKDVNVGLTETADGDLQLQVGESTYQIDTSNATDVEVDEQVVDTIQDVNLDTYEELGESEDMDVADMDVADYEPVESGLIKSLAKTLLLGGLVKLTSKMLKNEVTK